MPRISGYITSISLVAALFACVTIGSAALAASVQERHHEFGIYQLYIPDTFTADSNVVVVVHGSTGENEDVVALARTFTDRWLTFAENTGAVIVAPAFDQENYDSCDCGAYGGYRGLYGREAGADEFLHQILDEVAQLAPTSERRFYLYGHSAGGQFAARYIVRHPERVLGIVLSAPGRYAFPDENASWHYGMKPLARTITWPDGEKQDINVTPDPDRWVQASNLPISIVIGDKDINPQLCQPAHCPDVRCESTRIAIGERWMKEMNALAAANDMLGGVRMEIVPGVGHSSAALTDDAQEVLRNLIAGRVSVPDVVGMTERQALDVLEKSPLQGRTGEPMLSERPKGEVVLQTPQPDRWVERGSSVVISVSLGVTQPDPTTVPDVVGETLQTANSAVRAAGFTPSPTFVNSDRPFEEVISQSPAGGDRAARGTEVQLFVSKGTGPIE